MLRHSATARSGAVAFAAAVSMREGTASAQGIAADLAAGSTAIGPPDVDNAHLLRESELRYRTLVEHAPEAIVVFDVDAGRFVDVNDNALRLFGIDRERVLQIGPVDLSPPCQPDGRTSREAAVGRIEAALAGQAPAFEWVHLAAAGPITCEIRLVRLPATGRKLIRGSILDITERKRIEMLRKGQNRLLEQITTGMPLSAFLGELALLVESVTSGLLCSVLLLDEDGQHLRYGAAPSLPAEYNAAVDGVPIGPRIGSCGTAAFRREPVFVADIATDPLWADFPDLVALAAAHDMRSCWSTPILTAAGRLLGTFALYHGERRLPHAFELEVIESATHLAALAIEHRRAEAAMRDSERAHRDLYTHTPMMMHSIDRLGRIVAVSDSWLEGLGYTREEVLGRKSVEFLTPESRRKAIEEVLPRYFATGICRDVAYQFVRKNGELVDVLLSAVAERDASGVVQRSLAVLVDVTEKKRAEERLVASLREKDVLIREIHHRVKNNLQIISSLLNLQRHAIADPALREVFRDSYDRVRAMALIHEQLYRTEDLGRIDVRAYVQGLAANLVRSHGVDPNRIAVDVQVDDVALGIDTAIPCGLLVNELVANALKHAFVGRDRGRLGVGLRTGPDGTLLLRVADDGVGIPAHVDPLRARSLGLQLVSSLAAQLGGSVRVTGANGTTVEVSIAEIRYQERI
jgi:PAS domain S-box-containing protein